jgi:DNA-binding response OmpR family regulator
MENLLAPNPRRDRPDARPSGMTETMPSAMDARWVGLPGGRPRIAVIDQDSGLLLVLAKRLDRLNWEHRVLMSAPPPERMAEMHMNAVVVDLSLLGDQGWEWLEQVRAFARDLGIVVCAPASTVADRVRALRLGADDWLGKPCHPEELVARLTAVLRRQGRADPVNREPIVAGDLEIQSNLHRAFVRGEDVNLTRREFELIQLLASHEGRVLRREFIYQSLWGGVMMRGDRSVDVFVRKIRQKLEALSPQWRYIHTHFAVGYSFAAVAGPGAAQRRTAAVAAA